MKLGKGSGAANAEVPMGVAIYHDPDCETSRNTLAMIRDAGIEPHVVEYLITPPVRTILLHLIRRAGLTPRGLLREKTTPFAELGLGNPALKDGQLVDAMMAHPILIDRPFVVTSLGVRLCRPSEAVLSILPPPQRSAFLKKDGEAVVNDTGGRVI
jgi:arsenate reductase